VICEEDIGSLDDDDKPFNFNMEKYDSFMVESEDGLGLSYGSNKLRNAENKNKRNPMDLISDIFRGKPKQENDLKSRPLSKMVRRQVFDNFAETSSASRNLLSQGSVDNKSTDPNNADPASV
jgi:hypothetical protein